MNKQEIMDRLRTLDLPGEEYWVITGSAMVLYGIREETHDIDLGCTSKLADRLEADGYPAKRMPDGTRKFVIGSDTEVFEGWLCGRVETVEGFPVISLPGLITMKESLGREKDMTDIAAIREYLQRKNGD